ncbi:hypothetical protein SAMN05444166_0604 [Singulisphaera sp. GP187]|uniref:hypothetical protein n=1 Tax=Singulisphaera sp. GP187 TaxID=1882752 RepID=UPI000928E725|nr:hypothetical protein [Singulisphaera sp. GP187]SIN74658.1 hypothetical protein SAMN05444166_0604 [Singulisphaera sp. GP187]
MGRRDRRPYLEEIERRELLSLLSVLMIDNQRRAFQPYVLHQDLRAGTHRVGAGTTQFPPFTPSKSSIAVPANQGASPTNQAVFQTGNLTPHEQKRQRFVARFEGPYIIGPGRTDTEAIQTFIRGVGSANTILHGDIQLSIITPKDPNAPLGAVAAIFDRNLNSNTVLGFDADGAHQNVDSAGRPNHLDHVTIDANESSGVYDEAFSQGTITIRYKPNGQRGRRVIDQGTAVVTIRAQIYTTGTDFILRNADINP